MNRVARVCFFGTGVLGVGGFALSFAALRDLAVMVGLPERLAWVWPLLVDGLIVEATMAVVVLAAAARRARLYAWMLLVGGAVVSLLGNAAHALLAGGGAAGAAVASVPPLILVFSTHLTVVLARERDAVEDVPLSEVPDVEGSVEVVDDGPGMPATTVEAVPVVTAIEDDEVSPVVSTDGAGGLGDQDRELLVAARRLGMRRTEITAKSLAVVLGVSESTGRRRLRRLSELVEDGYSIEIGAVS